MTFKKYLKIWLGFRFMVNFARQMLALIVAWQVYQISHSALALGFLGLAEAVPYMGCALISGHLADRYERRLLMILSVLGMLTCAVALTAVSLAPRPSLALIYFIVGMGGAISSLESSSTAYMQTLVPQEHYPKAIAWNLTLFQTSTILGPIVGGAVLSHFSAEAAYGTAAVILIGGFLSAVALKKIHPVMVESDTSLFSRVVSGIKFLASKKPIWSAMSLDMVAVLFGDAVALFPVFAEKFGMGPVGLGILRASPAVGSALISLTHSFRPVFKIRWNTLLRAVAIFGASMIAFALSRNFELSVLLLAIGGAADGTSVIIRQSIYQALTPDHLRGRVSAVNGIFISTSNEIGAFESGALAKFIGAVPSVLVGGSITLASVLFMRWKYPTMEEVVPIRR